MRSRLTGPRVSRRAAVAARVAGASRTPNARARALALIRERYAEFGPTFAHQVLIGDDERILGFTMIGAEADGVMTVVQTAMLAKLPHSMLRDAILTHPTMAEGLGSLLANVPPMS